MYFIFLSCLYTKNHSGDKFVLKLIPTTVYMAPLEGFNAAAYLFVMLI